MWPISSATLLHSERNNMTRIRADLNPEWADNPQKEFVRSYLKSAKPDAFLQMIGAYAETPEDSAIRTYVDSVSSQYGIEGKVNHGWIKGEEFSFHFKNDVPETPEIIKMWSESMDKWVPTAVVFNREVFDKPRMAFINTTDIHIDKLAWRSVTGEEVNHWNTANRFKQATADLLAGARHHQVEQIWMVLGSDMFNSEGRSKATAAGTPQMASLPPHDAFILMFQLWIECILAAAEIANVKLIFAPGNHDPFTGWSLGFALETYFKDYIEKGLVEFDLDFKNRKAFQFGNCLVGVHHGDKLSPQRQLNLLTKEYRSLVGQCEHVWIFNGHIHQTRLHPFENGHVRYCAAISGTDEWHYENGFVSRAAMEMFIFDKERGKVHETIYSF